MTIRRSDRRRGFAKATIAATVAAYATTVSAFSTTTKTMTSRQSLYLADPATEEAFAWRFTRTGRPRSAQFPPLRSTAAPTETDTDTDARIATAKSAVLTAYSDALAEGQQWAEEFGFAEPSVDSAEGRFYAIFRAIRNAERALSSGSSDSMKLLGLNGTPFHFSAAELAGSAVGGGISSSFGGYFALDDLADALEQDFLDAQRGSTDNRKGWKVTEVSQPTGKSFESARMTLPQVRDALEKGTVIFNNIGAHIPQLAVPTLACTDATGVPGAANMYVTAKGMRTSAPPHTDRQDVVVIQMTGQKRWRVFSPPTDGFAKPGADPFARGKGDDNVPLHSLLEGKEGRLGCELLADLVLQRGDVLFIPAGFPHTTDTVTNDDGGDVDGDAREDGRDDDTSIHLTFNVDTHVWDLDYLSVRRIALQRNGVRDALSSENQYIGEVNRLPHNMRAELLDALPLEFLDEGVEEETVESVGAVAQELERICSVVEGAIADIQGNVGDEVENLSSEAYREAVEQVRSYASSILDVHRDMYISAVEEGRLRESEAAMTAHLDAEKKQVEMTPERIKRLSVFRVREHFAKINALKKELEDWSTSGSVGGEEGEGASPSTAAAAVLDPNWEFTCPLTVGDEVEADLGGAFFSAKVSAISGDRYNVMFFDGDRGDGLERGEIKALVPPKAKSEEDDIDTMGLTPKEIKKLRKKMEKKKKKGTK